VLLHIPGKTGNSEIVFSLKRCMLFAKNAKHHKILPVLVTVIHFKAIDYVHQTGPIGMAHNILQYVSLTLEGYQVCHCVSRCVKIGVVLIKHRSKSKSQSQWTVLLGYLTLTLTTNVRCYYRVVYNNFVFQQDSAQVHLAFTTVQLMQCKTLNFLSPELRPNNSPELNSADCEI